MSDIDTTLPTESRRTRAKARLLRALAVLSLLLALLAIPALTPTDASAQRMSERGAVRACSNAGGRVFYDFTSMGDLGSWSMMCFLPSGNSFTCVPYATTGPYNVGCG